MAPLPRELRRLLERVVIAARDAAEDAARAALRALSVDRDDAHSGIGNEDRALRVALRARVRQLGEFDLLVAEVAYEQWHRMLFARFLAENGLLMHPSGVAVTLVECAELADAEGEPDAWMLAARYAGQMLPGIFRNDDPSVQVRFARDDVAALERLLVSLPKEAFTADDALGWVYQFWQSKKKREVNSSERKIGGADLPPVTQLFTEDYMVSFLLENSLGAWWQAKHPTSPLLADFGYLRFDESGAPVVGVFEHWPSRVAELTMMDPCCGSGHFLVAAFEILSRMRQEEEGCSAREAGDAVLRDNLYGLELDGRCVQIAVFALALQAWKTGGYRKLPAMNIACSGVSARGSVDDWRSISGSDTALAGALERLFYLFQNADTLGSLIDPRAAAETDTLLGVDWASVEPLLHEALFRFGADDPAQRVFGAAAEDVATAANLLSRKYTLTATNPPYLGSGWYADILRDHIERHFLTAKNDLAAVMQERCAKLTAVGGAIAVVVPETITYLKGFEAFRRQALDGWQWEILAALGSGAFDTISGEVVKPVLWVATIDPRGTRHDFVAIDVSAESTSGRKAEALACGVIQTVNTAALRARPALKVILGESSPLPLLLERAYPVEGLSTGDNPRYRRKFWELPSISDGWTRIQGPPSASDVVSGMSEIVLWEDGKGDLARDPGARIQGHAAWGRPGVLVGRMSSVRAGQYLGELFDKSCVVLVPREPSDLRALLEYSRSAEYEVNLRAVDRKIGIATASTVEVPFDVQHWGRIASQRSPEGIPEPTSNDPTQWLFDGDVVNSILPLHVAVARLTGYSWPGQTAGSLDDLVDRDGVVCIPPVAGERPAADRVREMLAVANGAAWSETLLEGYLAQEGAADLDAWLRNAFFGGHAKMFAGRPFVWQIWDGRRDGFSALVNYHTLDLPALERLTYTTLQWWVDRQRAEAASGVSGAEPRLAAALALQGRLRKIIEGEPPLDIYVRWRALAKQPVGWQPDLRDGVRANIRPFVEAGVLRSKFTINWSRDRGTDSDGAERLNDRHFSVAEKLAARGER